MSEALVPIAGPTAITGASGMALPRLIVEAGPAAAARFLEFFAAQIANDQTRAAYARAAGQFLAWCEARDLSLRALGPLHVAPISARIRARSRR